jgi:hypothetical protein
VLRRIFGLQREIRTGALRKFIMSSFIIIMEAVCTYPNYIYKNK